MKLMLVDDDPLTRTLLKRALRGVANVECVEAADGFDAWEKLQQGDRPDLCLLDVMMPGMDGIDLLRKMRSDQRLRNVRVVLCTIVRDRPHVEEAVALNIQGYILKPFRVACVVETVERALRERMENGETARGTPANN